MENFLEQEGIEEHQKMKILQIIKGMGNFFEAYCLSIYDFKNIALVSIYFLSYFVTTSSVMLGQLITM